MGVKILVVDDAIELTRFLEGSLVQDGYQVLVAHTAQEGLRQAYHAQPDLILLDVMMPGMDGWEMLTRLREFSDVPVVMLTAVNAVDFKVHGLEIGADDYLTKPFEMRELKARVQAVLRRVASPSIESGSSFTFDDGNLILTPSTFTVIARGQEVDLTPIEHRLLLYLARNAGRVMTYEQILDNVWGPGYEDSLSNVKVYVRRLRRKIEVEPSKPRHILTQWGVGYYLAAI
jgi:two-component system KDP operon response regulator KdpE